jgi:hypothetical protein
VSTSFGIGLGPYAPARLAGGSGARDVARLARVDLDPLARVDEERHLDDGPVSSVAGFVTFETVSPCTPGSVSATSSSTEAGSWIPAACRRRSASAPCSTGCMYGELVATSACGRPNWLVRLLVHEVRLVAVVVEELDVLHLGVDARELLAGAERASTTEPARAPSASCARTRRPCPA